MKTESSIQPGPVYLDSSALVKIYLPEPESERVDALLRGRRDLLSSDLAVTEIVSAVARRYREGTVSGRLAQQLGGAILQDMDSSMFQRVELGREVFREAERILLSIESVPLRAADSLHLALAVRGEAKSIFTFDARLTEAAIALGLGTVRF